MKSLIAVSAMLVGLSGQFSFASSRGNTDSFEAGRDQAIANDLRTGGSDIHSRLRNALIAHANMSQQFDPLQEEVLRVTNVHIGRNKEWVFQAYAEYVTTSSRCRVSAETESETGSDTYQYECYKAKSKSGYRIFSQTN